MTKRKKTEVELKEALDEQISHIKSSCKLFDEGDRSEAKRIAVATRILVHDTDKSISLLTQLNAKNSLEFIDTSFEFSPSNLMSHEGLTYQRSNNVKTVFMPILDEFNNARLVNFPCWWDETIIKPQDNVTFSRKDIVLYLANKDGGAHIDPDIEGKFDKLQKLEATGWFHETPGHSSLILGIELASVRQIGHELLATLKRYRAQN